MLDLSQHYKPRPKPEKREKKPYKGIKRSAIKRKPKGNTDQSDAMQEKYADEGGICEVTGVHLGEYEPSKVHHYLNKRTYSRYKNDKRAMIVIDPELHFMYHNQGKEYVIANYGAKANILYDKADELRAEYYQPKPTV